MDYGQHFNVIETPQSGKIPGSKQVANSAGGFAFAVDDWVRLDRFLILGAEGGSYYAKEKALTRENAEAVMRCISADGLRAVARITEISDSGRAPKNDPAIFALAMAAGLGDAKTKTLALAALPKVCRIGTHLFHFAQAVQGFRGWGRGLRRAIAHWYLDRPLDNLANQLAKYQQRDGWSHRDLLRLSHPTGSKEQSGVFGWAVGKTSSDQSADGEYSIAELPRIIQGFQAAFSAKDARPNEAAKIISEYKLPRECVPTEWLRHKEVWEALLDGMPMTAMVRNLGSMSKVGLLKPMSGASKYVCARLSSGEDIKKSRLHPVAILMATKTYGAGCGLKGSGQWDAVPQVIDALDGAYYAAFENVEPTGKNWYLGLDISGSMWGGNVASISDFPPAVAAGAMAMMTVKKEANYYCAGFTCEESGRYGGRWGTCESAMTPVSLSPKQRLDDVVKTMEKLQERMGGTDCALPMLDALEKKIPVDVFVVYTDSETWAGKIHPVQALRKYRDATGRAAKLIVVGMVSNGFSIADPDDGGMLDVVGFDTATPLLMADFARN